MRDIVLEHVAKAYGATRVFDDLSAVFPGGETTCVMGPSGCGKTTLLRLLMGFEKPDAGTISGVPGRISAVFQENRLCEPFTARANVRLVTGKRVSDGQIDALLSALGLGEALTKPVREFSGGMKRRAAIARALLAESGLLLLDEPFKGLDETTRAATAALIRERAADRTVLLVTHERDEAALFGGRILQLG